MGLGLRLSLPRDCSQKRLGGIAVLSVLHAETAPILRPPQSPSIPLFQRGKQTIQRYNVLIMLIK
jgi:hypothetical protein